MSCALPPSSRRGCQEAATTQRVGKGRRHRGSFQVCIRLMLFILARLRGISRPSSPLTSFMRGCSWRAIRMWRSCVCWSPSCFSAYSSASSDITAKRASRKLAEVHTFVHITVGLVRLIRPPLPWRSVSFGMGPPRGPSMPCSIK